ncbi:hypothetical protein [Vibrio splendidus]|uniref:hypothetical protein n=1 Tax=Vibrio splendidus TaxID=29497 RepID=UPI000D338EFF|nr:hypothetical protein [Vibrio splendidus]PTP86945.1 hypothetical protein CWO03_12705 [Vibrio splendidus]
MKDFFKFFKAEFIPLYYSVLFEPKKVTHLVELNRISWKFTLSFYASLLIASLFIFSRIIVHHVGSGSLSVYSIAFFQSVYALFFAGLLHFSFKVVGSIKGSQLNLKLVFLNAGMLYFLNSLLLPFQIQLDTGGSKLLIFTASILVFTWSIRCWLTLARFNGVKGKVKLGLALIILILALTVFVNLSEVIVPYFVDIV